MRPEQWELPTGLSASEQVIVKRIRRAKLFIFLREHRHEIFTDTLQEELASRLVLDKLNAHTAASLYEAFPQEEAQRNGPRLEVHYTRHPWKPG